MHGKGQGTKNSGVLGRCHNRLADNEIKDVFRIPRTMIIHAALKWSDTSDNSLWPMAMDHAVNSNNHTTHIFISLYTYEVWTR